MTDPYAPLNPLLDDPEIMEIMIDGWQRVYVDKRGEFVDMPGVFASEGELIALIQAVTEAVGLRADESHPLVDVRLADGSRMNIAMPPIALNGPVVTLRKFLKRDFSTEDFIAFGSFSAEMAEFLHLCVLGRLNILVAGGTGSGKTTILHLLGRSIPADERILVLQSADEFTLPQPRAIKLETRPANLEGRGEVSLRDLVNNALHMRPDRILLTEAHGAETLDLLTAMNNGHDGTMFSLHAGGVQDTLARLEVLAGSGNPSIPLVGLREMIASAIGIITYQERMSDGTRRLLKISEITGLENGVITTRDLFEFRRTGVKDGRIQGVFTATGAIPTFLPPLREAGIDMPVSIFTPKPSKSC